MFRRIRPHLTYANIMSTVACAGVLAGGTAYANHLVVTGTDVVDESLSGVDVWGKSGTSTTAAVNGRIKGEDIYGQAANPAVGQPAINGSITGYDVADGTLRSTDVLDGTLSGADIDESTLVDVPLGRQVVGARHLKERTTVSRSVDVAPNGGVNEVRAECALGEISIGGGAYFDFPSGDLSDFRNYGGGVLAEGQNNGNAVQKLYAFARCLPF